MLIDVEKNPNELIPNISNICGNSYYIDLEGELYRITLTKGETIPFKAGAGILFEHYYKPITIKVESTEAQIFEIKLYCDWPKDSTSYSSVHMRSQLSYYSAYGNELPKPQKIGKIAINDFFKKAVEIPLSIKLPKTFEEKHENLGSKTTTIWEKFFYSDELLAKIISDYVNADKIYLESAKEYTKKAQNYLKELSHLEEKQRKAEDNLAKAQKRLNKANADIEYYKSNSEDIVRLVARAILNENVRGL